jgi:RNA-directed DNA polymerase
MVNRSFYSAVARSILAGDQVHKKVVARLRHTLGRNWRWLSPLVRRYLQRFGTNGVPRHQEVVAFLFADSQLRDATTRYGALVRIANWVHEPNRMRPAAVAQRWGVPAIESVGELTGWLRTNPCELQWLANLKQLPAAAELNGRSSPLNHYHYKLIAKNDGSFRLIEAPKRKLKVIQSKILKEILELIPVHGAVHGFRAGHSIQSFAAPHVGRHVVLRLDLRDFFPSLNRARVQAIFRIAGYPEPVAELLAGLCTNAIPRKVIAAADSSRDHPGRIYERAHLPQGAPSSPALSNLCAYRLDCRIAGLARAAGAVYTRYADDLAFSGGPQFARGVERFASHAAAIILEEGFAVNHRKTRVMRRGVRQHVAGLVVNERINLARRDIDSLKATLTNCVRLGPDTQNREGHSAFQLHLDGRVGFVESVNPEKGARLRRIYEQIQW